MKKLLGIMVVALLAVAGCAPAASPSTPASPLRVGMELAYPPFEGKDAAGNPSGVGVDLAKALGDHLNRPVEIENIAWDGLIPSLQSGKVDVVISSMTITPKRAETVTFSDPYAKAYLAFLVNSSAPVTTAADLDSPDRTIAVKKGTTGEVFVRGQLTKARVTALSSENAAVTEVVQGKADAFIYDQLTIYRQSLQNEGKTTMVAIHDQQAEEWGAAVKKDNSELRDQINEFLKGYRARGGFTELTNTYLATEKKTFDELGFRWFFE